MRPLVLAALAVVLGACGKAPDSLLQGYIEGEYVLLASPHAGQLQKLHVRRGQSIEAGKPVFVLEQENEAAARREAEEKLKSAQARLDNLETGKRAPEVDAQRAEIARAVAARDLAASQLAREEKLVKEGFVAPARLDALRGALKAEQARVAEAQAQLKVALQPLGRDAERKAAEGEVRAARAALAQADWQLEQKSVNAPVTALVQDTFFVEGEWVPAGKPVASLLPPGNVKARFYLPEPLLGAVTPGRSVEIRCDGCAAPVAATVSYISRQAEFTPPVLYSRDQRGKLLYLVEARPDAVDAARLRPGQPIDVVLK